MRCRRVCTETRSDADGDSITIRWQQCFQNVWKSRLTSTYHTYGTFGSDCYPAVEWALAMLAGVNTIYTNDLDALINIQASYIHVWETTDPYSEHY